MNRRFVNATFARAMLLAAFAACSTFSSAFAADAAHPAVVELFQSQGCSSCPPANANVLEIADRPDILALTWQVTYWDRLGWKDTFAKPAFTQRQWDYARAFERGEVGTPEIVVNGTADIVGDRRDELDRLLRQADRGTAGPIIKLEKNRVTVSGRSPGADVVLVRYDPRLIQVAIGGGENAGVTLPHRNVVRDVIELGSLSDGAATFDLPSADDAALRTAILIQRGRGGPIIAAAHD